MEGGTFVERWRWAATPLAVYAASRVMVFGLAYFATIYGRPLGTDPAARIPFVHSFPTLAALGHGEVSVLARIARLDYESPAEIRHFPLLPAVGRVALALGQSAEGWLVVLGTLLCGAAYVAAYRLFLDVTGRPAAAAAALGIWAAFPFAYHLSDGGALAPLALSSALGALWARRGAPGAAAAAVSAGVLAHPAAIGTVAALVAWGPLAPGRRGGARDWALALAPVAVAAGWLAWVTQRRGLPLGGLVADFGWPSGPVVTATLPFALLALAGVALVVARGPRPLGIAAALSAAILFLTAGFPGTRALAACPAAFLLLGARLERWPAAAALAISMLALFQGLFFYLFAHRFPFQ